MTKTNQSSVSLDLNNKTTTKFEKVSLKQFKTDWINLFPEDENNEEYINNIYDNIILPKRATIKSAGYDFYIPMETIFSISGHITIPTGIRCYDMPKNNVLMIYPRSGLGTKYGLILANSTAIIDADYADSDNEGHIFIKMFNSGEQEVTLDQGKAFCQGILMNYNITENDSSNNIRNGGLGSTNL